MKIHTNVLDVKNCGFFHSFFIIHSYRIQFRKDKKMKNLFKTLSKKPKLYEQTHMSMWDDSHISKRMLKAHLDASLDSATRNHNFVQKSVEWIAAIAPPKSYPKLLDLGCGPGIYAELFCKKGYCVTGIDLSQNSIQYAVNSANKNGLSIKYILDDYTKIHLTHKYNLITLIYCDFGVLPPQTRRELLKNMYDALLPNGLLIFDVFTPEKYQGVQESKSWEICENGFWHEKLCLTFNSFYRYDEDNTFLNQYTLITKDNEIFKYNVWEHTFTFKELEYDLTQVGFKNIKFFKDVSGMDFDKVDHTICVLAKKQIE